MPGSRPARPPQLRRPVRRQHAVRRAGHRVLGDPRARREEARHEVVPGPALRPRGHDHPARLDRREPPQVGFSARTSASMRPPPARRSGCVPRAPAPRRAPPARPVGRRRVQERLRGKVQLDPLPRPARRQQPAARVEARLLVRRQVPVLPQHVRGCQRSVPAQIHLHRRREPAQPPPIRLRVEKRGLGQVHLGRHVPHPPLFARLREDAHGRRVAGEGAVREGVYLHDRLRHDGVIGEGE
jgi:hypothetical protein